MRQTSFGHILETKGTGEEKNTTEKKPEAEQDTPVLEATILTWTKAQEVGQGGDCHTELDLAPTLWYKKS